MTRSYLYLQAVHVANSLLYEHRPEGLVPECERRISQARAQVAFKVHSIHRKHFVEMNDRVGEIVPKRMIMEDQHVCVGYRYVGLLSHGSHERYHRRVVG